MPFVLCAVALVFISVLDEPIPTSVGSADDVLISPAFPSPPPPPPAPSPALWLDAAAVAPYFSEPKLAQAKAAFDSGAYTKARALFALAAPSVPVRYLQALSALRADDWATAAAELEGLASEYPAMRDRCLANAGFAYERLKRYQDASRCYAKVEPRSRLAIDASTGLARSLAALRDFSGARAALAPYVDRAPPGWGRDLGAEALLTLVEVARAERDLKAERAAILRLWSEHPNSASATRIAGAVGPLARIPDAIVITHAEALIDAHKNAQGLALMEPLLRKLKLPDATACQAHFVAGKALRKLRAHSRAVATLRPVAATCTDPVLRPKALYVLGFSQSIATPGDAVGTSLTLAREYPQHAFADDALAMAGELLMKQGQPETAQALLVELSDMPRHEFTGEALFKLFTIAFDAGRYHEAELYLEELSGRLASADEDPSEVDRAGYWRGRLNERRGDRLAAITAWSNVALDHPGTYYGLMAREQVERIDPAAALALRERIAAAPSATPMWPMKLGPLAEDAHFLAAVELARLGFGNQVTMEVLSVSRDTLPVESLRVLVHLLALAGETRAAHGMARLWLRRDLSAPITASARSVWEIAYPRAFRELVVTHSESADGLDPDLLQALMREESALDPKASSWAGAVGLCQLMPGTAAGVATQLRLQVPGRAALLEPDLNIRLGARYLADLVGRFAGVMPYALASYNAGPTAVSRWRQERPSVDLDAWVESIPLLETRGYVKRVLKSYSAYKLLYAPTETATTVTPAPKKGAGRP